MCDLGEAKYIYIYYCWSSWLAFTGPDLYIIYRAHSLTIQVPATDLVEVLFYFMNKIDLNFIHLSWTYPKILVLHVLGRNPTFHAPAKQGS